MLYYQTFSKQKIVFKATKSSKKYLNSVAIFVVQMLLRDILLIAKIVKKSYIHSQRHNVVLEWHEGQTHTQEVIQGWSAVTVALLGVFR